MSDVQFEGEQYTQTYSTLPQEKGMIGFLIKKGLAKDAKQANIILLVVVAIVILVIFLVVRSGGSNPPPDVIEEPVSDFQF